MPRFRDIPRFFRAAYAVDIDWTYLECWLAQTATDYGLDLEPDFQRPHVWTNAQRRRYVEYVLREGEYARDLYFNCPGFDDGVRTSPMVIVDGKQRLEAVRRFLRDELTAFGHVFSEYTDRLRGCFRFRAHVASFKTRRELLQFYLDINSGGVVHTAAELAKVRRLLAAEYGSPHPRELPGDAPETPPELPANIRPRRKRRDA